MMYDNTLGTRLGHILDRKIASRAGLHTILEVGRGPDRNIARAVFGPRAGDCPYRNYVIECCHNEFRETVRKDSS